MVVYDITDANSFTKVSHLCVCVYVCVCVFVCVCVCVCVYVCVCVWGMVTQRQYSVFHLTIDECYCSITRTELNGSGQYLYFYCYLFLTLHGVCMLCV